MEVDIICFLLFLKLSEKVIKNIFVVKFGLIFDNVMIVIKNLIMYELIFIFNVI